MSEGCDERRGGRLAERTTAGRDDFLSRGGQYEYRTLTIPRTTDGNDARRLLTYEAEAENVTSEDIIKSIFEAVEVP